MEALLAIVVVVLAKSFVFWLGMIVERGHHECEPCKRRHPDELRGGNS